MCEKGFEKAPVVCIPAISFIRDVRVTGCVTPIPRALLRLQAADPKNHGL